jgi:hypothetical protein
MYALPEWRGNDAPGRGDCETPNTDFMRWAKTGSPEVLASSISTIAHECCHGITAALIRKVLKKFKMSRGLHKFYR